MGNVYNLPVAGIMGNVYNLPVAGIMGNVYCFWLQALWVRRGVRR